MRRTLKSIIIDLIIQFGLTQTRMDTPPPSFIYSPLFGAEDSFVLFEGLDLEENVCGKRTYAVDACVFIGWDYREVYIGHDYRI